MINPWEQLSKQFPMPFPTQLPMQLPMPSMDSELTRTWMNVFQSFQNMDLGGKGPALPAEIPVLHFPQEKMQNLQAEYIRKATELWNKSLSAEPHSIRDRRFRGAAWSENPAASFTAAMYLLNTQTLMSMVDMAEGDSKTKERIRFAIDQWTSALSPSNFMALNPDALQAAMQSGGNSLTQGVQNLMADLKQGHMSMTDESVFEVGKNIATTEGAVVFENRLFQLIEYKALTDKVYERPLLVVPPCINKYYILDLQEDNSLLRYAASQGHRTFVVSWKNPGEELAQATWDDYVGEAVITAIDAVNEIAGSEQANVLGFCVGGTLLTSALAVLNARQQQDKVASATLLTTLLNFNDSGILDIFIDENMVRYREFEMGQGGLLSGKDLMTTFSFLRPNELVWNYVVGNYMKGQMPPAFDLLYWNSDGTNLPGPFYAWYLRNCYLENNLIKPGKLTICGESIDLQKLEMPFYLYGSQRDHIVPIGGAYDSTQVLPGEKRFVMGASGHIAGVINPPAANKRNYWISDDKEFPKNVEQWVEHAEEKPGSWWTDWSEWLQTRGGKQIAAPKRYGRGTKYKEIEPAPGRYVKERI